MNKQFDFVGRRKVMAIVSVVILVLAVVLSLVVGVKMDTVFKGGTQVQYSYTGTLDKEAVEKLAEKELGAGVTVDITNSGETQILKMEQAEVLDPEEQEALLTAFQKAFADNKIESLEVRALESSMGQSFFIKCLAALVLAMVLLIVWVGIRFRKIGGISAGLAGVYALAVDMTVAYLAFVIFQIPLNDNFVAVMLTILGYSLNDTIVIFDRIRENRGKMGQASIGEIVNLSLNQSLGRAISTSISTIIAMTCVAVVAVIMNLDAILSFAVPMLFGLVSGSLSSLFLCTPLWTYWVEHKEAKDAKKAAAKGKK